MVAVAFWRMATVTALPPLLVANEKSVLPLAVVIYRIRPAVVVLVGGGSVMMIPLVEALTMTVP